MAIAVCRPTLAAWSRYESFLRREIPRLVRSTLEQQTRVRIQPLEQALIESLPRIIQECQESAFTAYRHRKGAGQGASSVASPDPTSPGHGNAGDDAAGADTRNAGRCLQPTPAQEQDLAYVPAVPCNRGGAPIPAMGAFAAAMGRVVAACGTHGLIILNSLVHHELWGYLSECILIFCH